MEEEWLKQKLDDWYWKYSNDIYRYILMMTGDHDLSKDLTHDTFIKAYNSMDSFRGDASEKNWLYRIARNTTIDELRKRKPLQFVIDSYTSFATSDYLPEKIAELGETEAELYHSLHKLKRAYREVIVLRKIKELTIQETGEILSWTEGKVKITLHRALEALKKEMIREGYNHEAI